MDKLTSRKITRCIRCGTCCKKGGPVLHHEDKKILRNHHAAYEHLITIRKGGLTYNPLNETVEEAYQEMVKVAGKGDTWSCCFYREEDSSCMIYEHRFLECRLLKCWEPAEIMRIIGQHTIRRSDIINHDDPVLSIIEKHEQECSLLEVQPLINEASFGKDSSKALQRLSELVQKDMALRSYALSDLGLKPEYELFIFGRPLMKILKDSGLAVRTAESHAAMMKNKSSD
jgi:Fe-S-cluster containining protein